MHFSIYVRLLDLLWEHLDDEDRFRRLAHEAVERYIAYMRGKMDEGKNYLKSATPFPKCYLHKEKWTFDS